MGKFFLAIASFVLVLYLPTWIKNPSGEPYLVMRENSFQHITTFTQPYHDMMLRVSALTSHKKEETVSVHAWQDSQGNMHFSDQEERGFQRSQTYEVKDQFQGRLAFPQYWVWACMFSLWLAFYILARLATSLAGKLIKKPLEVFNRVSIENNEYDSEQDTTQQALPHQILGINEDATLEEVKTAYRNKIKQYHPDRVATMGSEIRELAQEKAVQINQAYRSLAGKK